MWSCLTETRTQTTRNRVTSVTPGPRRWPPRKPDGVSRERNNDDDRAHRGDPRKVLATAVARTAPHSVDDKGKTTMPDAATSRGDATQGERTTAPKTSRAAHGALADDATRGVASQRGRRKPAPAVKECELDDMIQPANLEHQPTEPEWLRTSTVLRMHEPSRRDADTGKRRPIDDSCFL